MSAAHTPGPVEILARLCLQSDRYTTDMDFRDAVDAVIGRPVYDAAPELLEALKDAYPYVDNERLRRRIGAVICKTEGLAA